MAGQGSNAGASAARAFGPIRSHPLFPAIVALWFAALFGLCSLAIRPVLFESLAQAASLAQVIPAAAPPLGMTARALIALALAIAGGLMGAVLGRALAASRLAEGEIAVRRRDSHPDAPSRRPVSALTELGESPLPDAVPAPMHDIGSVDSDCFPFRQEQFTPAFEIASLELVHLPEQASTTVFVTEPAPALNPVTAAPAPESAVVAPLGKAAQRILSADLDTLTPIELVERLGISMQRRRAGMPPMPAPASFASPPTPLPRLHPGQRTQAGNEQALRCALATLQRISGAA